MHTHQSLTNYLAIKKRNVLSSLFLPFNFSKAVQVQAAANQLPVFSTTNDQRRAVTAVRRRHPIDLNLIFKSTPSLIRHAEMSVCVLLGNFYIFIYECNEALISICRICKSKIKYQEIFRCGLCCCFFLNYK